MCDKSFNSEKQLIQHEQGKRHGEQLEKSLEVEENAKTGTNHKTKLCDFFIGGCKRGDCKFAHRPEDVTAARPICKYVSGKYPCRDTCTFARGAEEVVCSKMQDMALCAPPLKVSHDSSFSTSSQIGYTSLKNATLLASTQQPSSSKPVVGSQSGLSTTLVKSTDGTTITRTTSDSDNRVIEIVVTRMDGSNVTVSTTDVFSKTVTTVTTNVVTGNVVREESSLHDSPKKKKKKFRINLYCGNCGCQQEWDCGRILEPMRNADGSYRRSLTKDGVSRGLVRFRNRGLSRCTVCENQIMRSPLSAVCVHCNSLMGEQWTPSMNCTNTRGDNPKRQLKNFALAGTSSFQCAWCADDMPLHGAIAGKLINVPYDDDFHKGAGECYGFVMVH